MGFHGEGLATQKEEKICPEVEDERGDKRRSPGISHRGGRLEGAWWGLGSGSHPIREEPVQAQGRAWGPKDACVLRLVQGQGQVQARALQREGNSSRRCPGRQNRDGRKPTGATAGQELPQPQAEQDGEAKPPPQHKGKRAATHRQEHPETQHRDAPSSLRPVEGAGTGAGPGVGASR